MRYENGVLMRGTTRGDGSRGDDVTANVRTIGSLPAAPERDHGHVEVRGEVFMRRAVLEHINREREKAGDPPLANPRNTTAGTLKLLDPRQVAERRLDLFVYELVALDDTPPLPHTATLKALAEYGFPVNPHWKRCANIDEVVAHCDEWNVKRTELGYETDGMVIKVESPEHRRRLGATSKAPRWVIAFKFPAQVARTKLNAITIQVGKSAH